MKEKKEKKELQETKLSLQEVKEIFFESEVLTKVPKNFKVTSLKMYLLEIILNLAQKLPPLILAVATAAIVNNKMFALGLLVFSILLSTIKRTILAVSKEMNDLKKHFFLEYEAKVGNKLLSLTRNKVEKKEEDGSIKILSNTVIVDIIKNRFSMKFEIIEIFLFYLTNILTSAITFFGLIKLLSSQVPNTIFFCVIIIIISTFILKIIINSKEHKRRKKVHKELKDIRRNLFDSKRDLKEIEPMNNHHIDFMIDKMMKFQGETLKYGIQDTRESNKKSILISFINSVSVILVVLMLSLEGGVKSLDALKFANVISLSKLFSNILDSIEAFVFEHYKLKDKINAYRTYQKDYLEVLKVYKLYESNIETLYDGDIFVTEPFEHTYTSTNFTLKSNKPIKLKRGDLTLFKGESGAGKSTFIKILSGEIILNNCKKQKLSTVKYFNDDSRLGSGNVFEEITLELDESKVDFGRLEQIIKGIKLEKKFKTLNDLKKVLAVQLSNGMTQRVLLARTLYNLGNSDLVVVDEPIGSLDEKTAKEVMDFIKYFCNKDKKRFVIVCTHQYNIIKYLIEDTYEIVSITPSLSEIR